MCTTGYAVHCAIRCLTVTKRLAVPTLQNLTKEEVETDEVQEQIEQLCRSIGHNLYEELYIINDD